MNCDTYKSYSDLLSIAQTRYACRAFQKTPVPRDIIQKMLQVARTAPSDCNTQPGSLFILSGKALEGLRGEMYAAAGSGAERSSDVPVITNYSGVYQERRRACGWDLYNAVGVQKGDRVGSAKQAMENFRFFGAPHLAIVTAHHDLAERGLFDTGIYLGYLLLAAQALGVATVPQGAIAHYSDIIRKYAPIPSELRIICGVSFGFEDRDHVANSFRTPRAEVAETTFFVE
jgi:nitroreductase